MILKKLVVGPYQENCYIIGSETSRDGIVIDPGDEAREIMEAIRSPGLTIRSIVLTHSHIDHVGAVKDVKDATGAAVAIHTADEASLRSQFLARLLGQSFKAAAADRLLKDGDTVDAGDLGFKVVHTPGHTPGGICLLGHGVVFTGDTLFNSGIGRTDFPGGSYEDLMHSIAARLMTLPDATIVYPGHGPASTIGDERRSNPFLRQ